MSKMNNTQEFIKQDAFFEDCKKEGELSSIYAPFPPEAMLKLCLQQLKEHFDS